MAKSKPIGVRFDIEKMELIKREQGLETPQGVLNYLMDGYGKNGIIKEKSFFPTELNPDAVKFKKPIKGKAIKMIGGDRVILGGNVDYKVPDASAFDSAKLSVAHFDEAGQYEDAPKKDKWIRRVVEKPPEGMTPLQLMVWKAKQKKKTDNE